MFDASFFDSMKETAYFVRVARTPVLEWEDLKALNVVDLNRGY